LNRATYKNVGAIGNSGRAPTPEAHTPTALLSVAVDAAGAIYTANGWDEAGADFKKWDAQGNAVFDARYQIRNGNPNGAPYAIAVDESAIYCAMGGWAKAPWNHEQQLQRFSKADGKHQAFTKVPDKTGHIQVYEWPEKLVPPAAPREDAELMREPLRAVAVAGGQLLVADALAGKVRRYDKLTGEPRGEFEVPLPQALAVDRLSRVWVGHQHHRVSVFSAEGKRIARVLDDIGEIASLAFGPNGALYVADRQAGQVKVYDLTGKWVRLVRTHGQKAQAGDRAADRFFELRGAAVDPQGCLVTIQTEPSGGARLARWSPEGKPLWEHFGCEFVSLGNYGRQDPDTLYSMTFHRYHLTDRARGQSEYTGCLVAERPKYHADVHGVPRLLRLEGRDFLFLPTGDGLQVYRVSSTGILPVSPGHRLEAVLRRL
jgi:sugar lactone lactonase YvrE